MWQQLHDISEDAKQQGLESANQHEFNALVDQLEKDYEQHGTRRPTPFETKALFLCNHSAKIIPCTDRNKALALATIATLRIMEHLPQDKKNQIPDIIYTQAADHAKLDTPLTQEEKLRVLQWIDFVDKVDKKVIKIQCAARSRAARIKVNEKRIKHKSAIQMQRLERGRKARKEFKEKQKAAEKVQEAVRIQVAKEETKKKKEELVKKEQAVTVIQAQARKIAATAETEKLREKKVIERAEWKKEDTQSHIEELKLVKQAVEGLQKAVESVQTEAVNELKKTVDGMNEIRRQMGDKKSFMKGTHTNSMRRRRRRGKGSKSPDDEDIPDRAKPTPHRDPLVFGPPRPKPKPKPKRGGRRRRGRGARGKSPYLKGPRPKDKYQGFDQGQSYKQYVKITYDLHGHRIPVPITPGGSTVDMPNLSLGQTMKGRPHYGVSEAIPDDPEFLDGMEGKGHPPWRSAGGKIRPSPPSSTRSKNARSPPTHRGGRNQKHNTARMAAGITGEDPGIQAQKGWTLPRSKKLHDHLTLGRGSKELDQKAGVSPHLANWVEYRLHHRKRDLATKRRAEHLYNWEANKRKLENDSFNDSKYEDDFDDHMDSFGLDSFGSSGLGHSDDFDAEKLHEYEKKDLLHEAELMEKLRRHDEETDGVHSPHRHLSARRPKPHFGGEMHSIVESDIEHRHGSSFGGDRRGTQRGRKQQRGGDDMESRFQRKQKLHNLFNKGHKQHLHSNYQNQLKEKELEMQRMQQEMQSMRQAQFASKMKNATATSKEKIDMQVKMQMMENELQRQQQEKADFARRHADAERRHAEAERKRREYEELHQDALSRHDEEKQMLQQQLQANKHKGFASNLKMMAQKKKAEQQSEEMRQQSEQRIAEEMAKMYAEQQDEMKKAHDDKLEMLQTQMSRQQEMHEHSLTVAKMENADMKRQLSAAEMEAKQLKDAEVKATAEMKDMHDVELDHMKKLHDQEMEKERQKLSKKKFGGRNKKNALLKLQQQHDEELKAMRDKHKEDEEDMHLGFETEKTIINHAIQEEQERQEHDKVFDDNIGLDNLGFDGHDATEANSPEDAHDDFSAALAAMGHDPNDMTGMEDLSLGLGLDDGDEHQAMQHHEFEGLLAQLEQTHNEGGGDDGMMDLGQQDHHDEEAHAKHMEDFLNSFGDGFDDHDMTPSVSEYDTDSIMTGTDYTESLVPSSYAGTDIGGNISTAHEELLRHHERSRQHESHLTQTAHRVNHVIGALEDASRALDHPMHGK